MRLLFVSHSLPPTGRPMANIGGMQRVAQKLHESLAAKSERSGRFQYDSILLRSAWRTLHAKVPFFLARAGWKIWRAARRESVDVVLFSSMVTAALAVPLRGILRRHGIRTAAIVHGLDVTTPFPPYQWFVPKVFDALDAVLPVSRATRQACLNRGAPPEHLRVVPNGIDIDRFSPPSGRDHSRTSLAEELGGLAPPPDGALFLCSVGRQVERKGTAWFIEQVMPRLPRDVHYWIAGDGPESDTIQRAISRFDLHPRVRHLGRISDENLERLYRAADLFVMPNISVDDDMEGFGIVLLEAGLCETPAVAAALEGIQDVITDGVNGRLVSPEDPAAFEEVIRRYRDDPDALNTLSEQARQHIIDTFGWSAVSDRYRAVLERIAQDGHPGRVDEP